MKQLNDSLGRIFGLGSRSASAAADQAAQLSGARAMRRARALAPTIGVVIERDRAGGWWVTCPGLDPDPCDGENFCATGDEVLTKVQVYAAAKEGGAA